MAQLRLTLFGGFEARQGTGEVLSLPSRKARALLAYLALPLGRAHSRDKLAALLWGGIREESARASLRQVLFVVRKALGGSENVVLRQEGEVLALTPAAVEVDVAAFERAVGEGTPEALARAAALYHGDLLGVQRSTRRLSRNGSSESASGCASSRSRGSRSYRRISGARERWKRRWGRRCAC